ncbi:hypothetical protein [Streptosporangium sp. LJ11]
MAHAGENVAALRVRWYGMGERPRRLRPGGTIARAEVVRAGGGLGR